MVRLFSESGDRTTKRGLLPYLWVSVIILLVALPGFLILWSSHYSFYAINARKHYVRSVATVARAAINPILRDRRAGVLDSSVALSRARLVIKEMLYEDEDGKNYVFLGNYDGTMYVYPSYPDRENTNQSGYVDKAGHHLIADIVSICKNPPYEGFYSYYFRRPDEPSEQLKVSYVIALPELSCFLGTGVYAENMIDHRQKMLLIAAFASQLLGLLLAVPLFLANRQFRHLVALHNSNKKTLDQIMDNAGSVVLTYDHKGAITYINRYGLQLAGVVEQKVWKSASHHDVSSAVALAFPTLHSEVEVTLGSPLAQARSVVEEIMREGSRLWLSWTIHREDDTKGKVSSILCIGSDITDQKRAEEELRLREHELAQAKYMLELVLNTIPVRIFWKDVHSRIIGCNLAFARDALRADVIYPLSETTP